MTQRILIVDDEASVREVLSAYLRRAGYRTATAATGSEGLVAWTRQRPHLVLLDLMLPDVTGEELCRELRRRGRVPIIMLTAKAGEEERLDGLAIGADDYITKPFSPREVVARVRAVLRRSDEEEALHDIVALAEGQLVIDLARREVRRGGAPVNLTPAEFRIMAVLARQPGRAYSRAELSDAADTRPAERTVDAHVKNLRRKLGDDARQPQLVETIFGHGYRLGVG